MEFKKEDIEYDNYFLEFLDARGITDTTKRLHVVAMKNYCNFYEQSPTEIIDEAEKEQDEGIKRKKRKIRRKIINYINYLKQDGKSGSTIRNYLKTVKAFYYDCDIDIPRLPKNILENKDARIRNIGFDEVPTLEHVKIACNNTSPRNKALILLHFSSGMGSAEIRNLTYNDYLNSIKEYLDVPDKLNVQKIAEDIQHINDCVGTWRLYRYKIAYPYITFNSPESTKAIAEYLLYRISRNKPISNINDPLFVDVFNKAIDTFNYTTIFNRLNDKCSFGKQENGYRFLTSHRLRESFGRVCQERELSSVDIHRLLGHKVGQIDDAYLKTTEKRLKNEYLKVLPYLTLEKLEIIKYTDSDVKKLKRDLEVYKTEFNREREARINSEENMMNWVRKEYGWIFEAMEKNPKIRNELEKYVPEDQ